MSYNHSRLFFIICLHYFMTFPVSRSPFFCHKCSCAHLLSHLFEGSLTLRYFCILGNSSISTLDVIIFSLWFISYWWAFKVYCLRPRNLQQLLFTKIRKIVLSTLVQSHQQNKFSLVDVVESTTSGAPKFYREKYSDPTSQVPLKTWALPLKPYC